MYDKIKSFFNSIFENVENKKKRHLDESWNNLVTGDHIKIKLKDPKKLGLLTNDIGLTFQRLDSEDLKSLELEGYFIRSFVKDMNPGKIEFIELDVIKQASNGRKKLISYLLLKEEIEKIINV